MSLSIRRKKQAVLWVSAGLPSDALRLVAVPGRPAVLLLTPVAVFVLQQVRWRGLARRIPRHAHSCAQQGWEGERFDRTRDKRTCSARVPLPVCSDTLTGPGTAHSGVYLMARSVRTGKHGNAMLTIGCVCACVRREVSTAWR